MVMSKRKRFVLTGDELVDTSAFEVYVGGANKAQRLMSLYNNSYPNGTALDRLYGRAKTKEQVFEVKAKGEGFSAEHVSAFLLVAV
jgi:hypothetical protein